MVAPSSVSSTQTPAWVDLVIIIILILIMTMILFIIIHLGKKWRAKAEEKYMNTITHHVSDEFEDVNGYSWDFVIVFKYSYTQAADDGSEAEKAFDMHLKKNQVLLRVNYDLHKAGFEHKSFFSVQADEVFVKLRIDEERLLKEAERIHYKLEYDADSLQEFLAEPPYCIQVPALSPTSDIDPYRFIYGAYHSDYRKYFTRYPVGDEGLESILRNTDRLRLIMSIIHGPKDTDPRGCHLNLEKKKLKGHIVGFFPLHDHVRLHELSSRWLAVCSNPWDLHVVNEVKDYFGEKIGMHVLWLQHLTQWLIGAAAAGALAWINVATSHNNPDAVIMPYYSALVAIWATLLLEYWKRRESYASMRWGMSDLEDEERERLQFDGDVIDSPIDGQPMKYFPPHMLAINVIMSHMLTFGLISFVLLTLIGFILLKIELRKLEALYVGGVELGGIIVPAIQACVMMLYDYLYTKLAIRLNKLENHRTDSEYEDSLIIKTFAFRFVNNFAVLFYIAFAKPALNSYDPCTGNNCMKELQITLGTIFLSKIIFTLLYTIISPIFDKRIKKKENYQDMDKASLDSQLSYSEWSFMKDDYDELGGTLEDYARTVILFGYTTMFISAFPLATCLSLFSVFIEARLMAWKFTFVYRRPIPKGCKSIGTWYTILEIMARTAVVVNSALVAFTGSYADKHTTAERIWIFIGMSALILSTKYVISLGIPDVPLRVMIQLKRNIFFHDTIKHHESNGASLEWTRQIETEIADDGAESFVDADHIDDYDEDP